MLIKDIDLLLEGCNLWKLQISLVPFKRITFIMLVVPSFNVPMVVLLDLAGEDLLYRVAHAKLGFVVALHIILAVCVVVIGVELRLVSPMVDVLLHLRDSLYFRLVLTTQKGRSSVLSEHVREVR